MSEMYAHPSEPLAAFETAACSFDRGLLAARNAVIGESARNDALRDITAMMQLLKSEGRAAIGLLATSHSAEQRAMAEGCRARLADAVNLHRAACRYIKQGIVPPEHKPIGTRDVPRNAAAGSDASDDWQTAWAMVWVRAWYLPWASDRR
jgi:hypothetical protein